MLKKILGTLYRLAPARLFNRAANFLQPHFTVTVAAVVINDGNRVLLLKHRFREGSGWGIPGGFLGKAEQPEDALRRELREEVALEIEKLEMAFARAVKETRQVQIIFRCKAAGEPSPASIEVEQCEWRALDELPDTLPHSQREIIERALPKGEL